SSFCRECQGASNSVNISNIAQSLLKLFGMALKKVIMSKAQQAHLVSQWCRQNELHPQPPEFCHVDQSDSVSARPVVA
ncbi:hypothetical protein, partial [Thiolapillus sp.]|uniref:hypothetical protein n=1 Tax=Thiolapillus sp. TaxID=2017437 RepID=UPI003AF661A8